MQHLHGGLSTGAPRALEKPGGNDGGESSFSTMASSTQLTAPTQHEAPVGSRTLSGNRRTPNPHPPKFGAAIGEKYLDWRRSLELWIAGEGGELPDDVIGPRILSALTNSAARICKRLRMYQSVQCIRLSRQRIQRGVLAIILR